MNFFETKPSRINSIRIIFLGVVVIIISLPIMNYFFEISNYPVSFIESQLSFSGETIKSHYATMTNEEITLYLYGNVVDYFFMLGNCLVKIGIAVMVARSFEEDSTLRTTGLIMIFIGIIGTVFDAVENIFIVLMIFDPINFPDILAISHSVFALFKYTCTVIFYGWIIVAVLLLLIDRIQGSTLTRS